MGNVFMSHIFTLCVFVCSLVVAFVANSYYSTTDTVEVSDFSVCYRTKSAENELGPRRGRD